MLYKNLTIILLIGLSLVSCVNRQNESNKGLENTVKEVTINTANLIGSWEDQSEAALHFTLFEDGTAQSDNMKTLLYQEWFINDSQLSLVFESIGNKISSIDTVSYTIEQLDEHQLILKRNLLIQSYKRVED